MKKNVMIVEFIDSYFIALIKLIDGSMLSLEEYCDLKDKCPLKVEKYCKNKGIYSYNKTIYDEWDFS